MFAICMILCYPPVSCLSVCHIFDSFFCSSSTCLALWLSSALYVLIHYPSFLFVIILSSIISFVPTPPHMTPQPFDSLPLHRPDNVGIAPDVEEESHVRLSIPCVLMACSCLFELCPHRAKFFAYSLKLVFIIFVMLLKAFIIIFNITIIISSMSELIMFPSPSSLSYWATTEHTVLDMKSLTLTHLKFGCVLRNNNKYSTWTGAGPQQNHRVWLEVASARTVSHLHGIGAQQQVQNLNGADPY